VGGQNVVRLTAAPSRRRPGTEGRENCPRTGFTHQARFTSPWPENAGRLAKPPGGVLAGTGGRDVGHRGTGSRPARSEVE